MLSTNASDAADELRDVADEIEADFREERRAALEEARDLAKRRVPVDTGKLKRSIEIRGNSVVADTDYASFVNFGSEHNEATMFLTDAALDSFQNSVDRLRS